MYVFALAVLLGNAPCTIPEQEIAQQLALDWEAFDQGPEGFRSFVTGSRYCPRETGELIARYLEAHPELAAKQRYVSEFHAGQQFAGANDVARALPHFYRGFNSHEDPASSNRWNAYVRATIAFLEQDKETLDASVSILEARADNRMNALNLGVARRLQLGFGKTYHEAMRMELPEEK